MKKTFLLASAGLAATIIGAPAYAATGFIDAGYAGNDVGTGSGTDVHEWFADGAVSFELGDTIGAQVDATYENLNGGSANDDATGIGVHLYNRTSNHLIGVFGGAADSNSDTSWDLGLEAQGYMSGATFTGQFAYFDPASVPDGKGFALIGQLVGYALPNLSLSGRAGWVDVNGSGSFQTDGYLLGLGAEVQVASSPVSIFAGYDQFHGNDAAALNVQSASVGVRWNFGMKSLKERDQTGPGLPLNTKFLTLVP